MNDDNSDWFKSDWFKGLFTGAIMGAVEANFFVEGRIVTGIAVGLVVYFLMTALLKK